MKGAGQKGRADPQPESAAVSLDRQSVRSVVYVLPKPDYFNRGRRGRVTHALGVVEGLQANGVRVTVVSGPGTMAALSECEGARAVEVVGGESGPLNRWRWVTRLIVEVVETARLVSADAVIVRYAVSNAFRFAKFFARCRDLTACFEVNSLAYHQYPGFPVVLRRFIKRVECRILSFADLLYVVSNGLAKDIGSATATPVVVVPNAAAKQKAYPEEIGPVQEGLSQPIQFVYLGVFQPYYEFELVVQAFRMARQKGMDAELHFHGDGTEIAAIEAASRSATDVRLYGRFELDALLSNGAVGRQSVLLLPNRGEGMSEIGSPIKLYEYMSLGLPILASNVGQARDMLVENVTGIFYFPGNVESCSSAMMRLSTDAELRAKLTVNIREAFDKHHTWEARMSGLKAAIDYTGNVGS